MRETLTKQNWALVALMLVLGLLAVLRNGYEHPMLFYLLPLAALAALRQIFLPGNKMEGLLLAPLFLFLAAGAGSYFFSINRQETLAELLKTGLYLVLFWLAATRLQRAEGRRLGSFLLLLGALLGLFAVLFFLLLSPGRVTATFVNSNPFGLFMAMLGLLALGLLAEGGGWPVRLAAALTIDALLLSGSRGSLLAFLAAFFALWLLLPGAERRRALPAWLWTGGLAAVSLVLIFRLAPVLQGLADGAPGLSQVLVRSESFLGASAQGRISFWQVAGRMIEARPLTGFGLGNYQNAYMFFRNQDYLYSRYTHNQYLQTWAEAGVFSLLGMLIFLLLFARLSWRRRDRAQAPGWYAGLAGAALAFTLHMAVDFSWNMPAVAATFWTILGLLHLEGQPEEEMLAGARVKPGGLPGAGRLGTAVMVVFLALAGQQLLAHWLFAGGQRAALAGAWPRTVAYWQAAERVLPVNPRYPAALAVAWEEEARQSPAQAAVYRDQALAAARRAVRLSPWEHEYHRQLGRLARQAGRRGEAEASLRAATRYGGFVLVNYLDLGYFYLAGGQWVEAENALREGLDLKDFALRNAPTAEHRQDLQREVNDMRLGLARALEAEGREEAVREQLAAVLEQDPGNPVALRQVQRYQAASYGGQPPPFKEVPAP